MNPFTCAYSFISPGCLYVLETCGECWPVSPT